MQPIPGLTLDAAYALAAERHAQRVAAGEVPIGRKIGHTNPANWPAQGICAPTWGWLYASSTAPLGDTLSLAGWREPKVELECVLRIGANGAPDAMALGLEIVDRPYPSWQITVPDSVAVNGVHAAMRIGPWQPVDEDLLARLTAELRVGEVRSEGGSAMVFGSPLIALTRLIGVLRQQGAPGVQAGDIVTSGALAPALPMAAGRSLCARIPLLGAISLRLV